MKNILFAEDVQPVSEFRSKAAGFLSHIHKTKRPMILTQNGKSAAVLLDVAVYDQIVEKLEILQDVEVSLQQFANGQAISQAEVRRIMKSRYSK